MDFLQSRPKSQHKDPPEPLIYLPHAAVAIFPEYIVQYARSKDVPVPTNTTLPTLNDLEQVDKALHFTKNDIAFKLEEEQSKIRILTINRQKTEMEFTVPKREQLAIVQQILRRKLCELGFGQKFITLKELGKGATAKVYLVERKSDGKKFAAKIISLKTADNKEYESFVNETKILKCLKNKYIVNLESLFISKKELICVLEYLQGGTLLDQLKSDNITTERQKCKAVKDITEGLEHMRQKRIVHRDLKLQNIMVRVNADKSKDYVITDFGLACWIGDQDLIFQRCGTPGYIAPEILKANKNKVIVSHVSDIFSLGVIFHFIFLLRAVFPFNGNPKELLMLNKKATFSLQTKYHFRLLNTELVLLHKTLELDVKKRPNSRELLDVYIKAYEKEVGSPKVGSQNRIENSYRGSSREQTNRLQKQGEQSSTRRERISLGKSIEMIEKRVPSVDKNQFSNRMKSQPSHRKEEEREGSLNKFINKIWNKITSPRVESMKVKDNSVGRKKSMKNYLS